MIGSNFSKKKLTLVAIVVFMALLLGIGALIVFLGSHPRGALPEQTVKAAGFPVYYPSPVPTGFIYQKDSARIDHRVLFFTLQQGNDSINVSEQAATSTPPDFSAIQKDNNSFKTLSVIAGQAIYGTYQGIPVAIVLTNTTLVTISGTKNFPIDAIAKTAQNLSSLPH